MLTSGTKLGPYEIQSPLGAGGMGEVYRARDTRLDRTVAIKILPQHLSEQPEARERFEREARAISSLNHANICQLYDVGQQDGVHYLVMEYLEGETLATRLTKGPLPLEQVLRHGAEIADGLDKAHRSGVIHRDLKPGNIMLTKSGAKLMDFGLAKTSTPSAKPISGLSATMTSADASHPLTAQGTVLGTYQYMSPEQVEGKEADSRSDIFSLGAVLYEMTTGKRAFEGKSQISIASAILEKDPDPITTVHPLAPPALQHAVESCMAKDPEARWQSAADIVRELRWISSAGSRAGQVLPVHPHRKFPERAIWIVLAALLLGVLLWAILHRSQAPSLRTYLLPPLDTTFDFMGDFSGPPVLSPDGTQLAFAAHSLKERNSIWIRDLSNTTARKLAGTEGVYDPFWSADGRYVGFFADGKLKKVPAAGGPTTVLADAPNARGGTWNSDNVILFAPDYREAIWKVSASGGTPTRATHINESKHSTHRWPAFLPDRNHFLYLATNHAGGVRELNGIYLGSLDNDAVKLLLPSDSSAQYAAGYLLFHQQNSLMAQKFDVGAGTLSGDPVAVADDVQYDAGTWHTTFSTSETGLLIYEPGVAKVGDIDLVWMNREGKILGHVGERAAYKGARPSPDGKRLALALGDPKSDIWIYDLEHGSRTRLTFDPAAHMMPSWSPDGQRVAFMAQAGPTMQSGSSLHARLANGGGEDELLLAPAESPASLIWPHWSPDGRYLVYQQQSGPTGGSVWAVPVSGTDRKPFPLVKPASPQARVEFPRLSPDGHWLMYAATDSGREEIYVAQFPSGNGRWQVSREGGLFPVWRPDGKELYYLGLDTMLYGVEVKAQGDDFAVGNAQSLFTIKNAFPLGSPFEVAPDGRFLVAIPPEGSTSPLLLIQNWTAQLGH